MRVRKKVWPCRRRTLYCNHAVRLCVKEVTGRSRGISMHRGLTDLNRYLRHLVQLGVDLQMAIKHAISRKRYWRMSRTPFQCFARGLLLLGYGVR